MLWVAEGEAEAEVEGVEAGAEEEGGPQVVTVWQEVQLGILQGWLEHRQALL